MKLGYLFGFIVVMWVLIVGGGFILVKVVGPFQIDGSEIVSSVIKAAIAISMVIIWVWIMVMLKNYYIKRRLVSGY